MPNSEKFGLRASKRPLEVPNPSVLHAWYPVRFFPPEYFAHFGLEKLIAEHAERTSPLLFSLAVKASGNTYRKKLALLLPLMHPV